VLGQPHGSTSTFFNPRPVDISFQGDVVPWAAEDLTWAREAHISTETCLLRLMFPHLSANLADVFAKLFLHRLPSPAKTHASPILGVRRGEVEASLLPRQVTYAVAHFMGLTR